MTLSSVDTSTAFLECSCIEICYQFVLHTTLGSFVYTIGIGYSIGTVLIGSRVQPVAPVLAARKHR